MIKGLDKFKAHFAQHTKLFVLIGGVACHEWLATQGLEFRATKDIDILLIVEALDQGFIARFWEFVEAGTTKSESGLLGRENFIASRSPRMTRIPPCLSYSADNPEKSTFPRNNA